MSRWASVGAEWHSDSEFVRNTILYGPPTGSEMSDEDFEGHLHERDGGGGYWVHVRLRDVEDQEDAPRILAWWTRTLASCDSAELMIDFDHGPRYRYVWKDGEIRKLKGVLDL